MTKKMVILATQPAFASTHKRPPPIPPGQPLKATGGAGAARGAGQRRAPEQRKGQAALTRDINRKLDADEEEEGEHIRPNPRRVLPLEHLDNLPKLMNL